MSDMLFEHQRNALETLTSGSILCGGVGSGKSRTAIAYFFTKECGGTLDPFSHLQTPKDLYIITTAKKRDSLDWERECAIFCLSPNIDCSLDGVKVTIDSWNNLKRYISVKDVFFIFDEQRVVGSGEWTKSFLKITKSNRWILLSATPGDTWLDYAPVFIANGFYKNRTDFIRQHVVYSNFSKFPKVDHYISCAKLVRFRDKITTYMIYDRHKAAHYEVAVSNYNKDLFHTVSRSRWNIFEDRPVRDINDLCFTMRKISNSDPNRLTILQSLYEKHGRLIVFYNFNYELELLRAYLSSEKIIFSEWNGQKHEPIQDTEQWVYLVQYQAGCEGWECTTANTIVFFSLNYSYKIMHQAAGRIDRLNTPYSDLYYYVIRSSAPIDLAIMKALKEKRTFNEKNFAGAQKIHPI